MSICGGVAGRRGHSPVGIFIHNDAGSNGANASFWQNYLPKHNLENGFAHYYVGNDGICQAEDDCNMAWHCGDYNGNSNYLSIEICQSMGNLEQFKNNEEKALQLAAEKCKQYGIVPNASTIRLHREVFSTACPHRSVEIHGGANGCKEYFINRINYYMGKTTNIKVNDVKSSSVISSTAPNMSATADRTINFTYGVMIESGEILDFVTNLADFAGLKGHRIEGVACKVDKGSIEYAVHELYGNWLPPVSGCDWGDPVNGFAGNGHTIDAFKAYYTTPDWYVQRFGYQQAQYRVSPLNGNFYDWQFDYDVDKAKGLDGYAGCFGIPIDALQMF